MSILSIFILSASFLSAHAREIPKKIRVIYSYPPNSWTGGLSAGFHQGKFSTEYNYQEYHFHAEYWQGRPTSELQQERRKIVSLINEPKFDGYIIADDEASEFLRDDVLAIHKPTVFTGINHSVNDPKSKVYCSKDSIALLEDYPYQKTFDTLKKIKPTVKTLLIVASDSTTTENYIGGLHAFLKHKNNGVVITKEIRSNSWEVWKQELLAGASKVDAIWVSVPYGVRDRLNEQMTPYRIGAWLKQNISVVSVGEITLADGVTIRVGMESKALGVETAKFLDNIFKRKIGSCPIASANYFIDVKKQVGQ